MTLLSRLTAKLPAGRRSLVAVVTAMVLFAIVYSGLAWAKYHAYMDARFDLGNMVQAVYNTSQGHFLEITTGDPEGRQTSRLGSHVDPILALFALPWYIWPSPVMLLVLQALIVASGAWPVFRVASRAFAGATPGALCALAYLLYPATGFLVLAEFHPVALATPLLLWAFAALDRRRWLPAAAFLVLAAACKETVPLPIGLMGMYFAWRQRSWRPLLITLFAAIYFVVAVWVIVPHFNQSQSAFLARYGDYGGGAGDVVRTALTNPAKTFADLTASSNLAYWLRLTWPLGMLALASPLTLLLAAPELLLNALSATGFQRQIEFHYTALAIPFIVLASVLGGRRVIGWLGWRPAADAEANAEDVPAASEGSGSRSPGRRRNLAYAVVALLCLAALVGNWRLGPLPLPGARYQPANYARDARDPVLDRAVALIPDGVPISVNNNVGAQLAARRVAYVFPAYDKADWVLVDTKTPFVFDKKMPIEYRRTVAQLLADPRFEVVFDEEGVLVLRRRAALAATMPPN